MTSLSRAGTVRVPNRASRLFAFQGINFGNPCAGAQHGSIHQPAGESRGGWQPARRRGSIAGHAPTRRRSAALPAPARNAAAARPPQRLLAGFLGTTLALLSCVGLLRWTEHPWLLPSLGGSCVILFGMARGVMAQPRSSSAGTCWRRWSGWASASAMTIGGPIELWAAAAVGAALTVMAATRTIHSPAGANPLVVFAEQAGPGFLLAPLLPGLAVLFGIAFLVNNRARPWGAGPWPRFREASPRRRGMRNSLTTSQAESPDDPAPDASASCSSRGSPSSTSPGPSRCCRGCPAPACGPLWKQAGPVRSDTGLTMLADTAMADCPQLDLLCVPGGPGVAPLMEDAEVLDFLRAQAPGARWVTSVCTGALVLGAAGLLRGKRATTHWASHDFLAALGAVPVKARVVRDGKLVTGGGVTAGIDFALDLVAEIAGPEAAQAIQLQIEYAPAPPFEAGDPATAPAAVLAAAQARGAGMRAEREALVARVAARLRAA